MQLIPIVWKKSRITSSIKFWGGILNVDARYYIRKVKGNHNPIKLLQESVGSLTRKQLENVNGHTTQTR